MKVWDVNNGDCGGVKCLKEDGTSIPTAYRVEFDGDGDEGMATVHRFETNMAGDIVCKWPDLPVDADGSGTRPDGTKYWAEPVVVTERLWVKMVRNCGLTQVANMTDVCEACGGRGVVLVREFRAPVDENEVIQPAYQRCHACYQPKESPYDVTRGDSFGGYSPLADGYEGDEMAARYGLSQRGTTYTRPEPEADTPVEVRS